MIIISFFFLSVPGEYVHLFIVMSHSQVSVSLSIDYECLKGETWILFIFAYLEHIAWHVLGSFCGVDPRHECDQKVVRASRIFLDVFSTLLGICTVFTENYPPFQPYLIFLLHSAIILQICHVLSWPFPQHKQLSEISCKTFIIPND